MKTVQHTVNDIPFFFDWVNDIPYKHAKWQCKALSIIGYTKITKYDLFEI
jgi:hypothetical protein